MPVKDAKVNHLRMDFRHPQQMFCHLVGYNSVVSIRCCIRVCGLIANNSLQKDAKTKTCEMSNVGQSMPLSLQVWWSVSNYAEDPKLFGATDEAEGFANHKRH